MTETRFAPQWPGIPPKWTSSAKSGIGTSLSRASAVWYTLSHGILNEVYYPRIDQACLRDFGFLVTDGLDFCSEEKRDTNHVEHCLEPGVPAHLIVNTCLSQRYQIHKRICTDPQRDVVLQEVKLESLRGDDDGLRLFALIAPHLANRGWGNTGWIGEYKGHPMLFAEQDGTALAVACATGWIARSVGFVGLSDGWQDLTRHKQLTWSYTRAENGNIALTGEVDQHSGAGSVVAIGFGRTASEAAERVWSSLNDGFEASWDAYIAQWRGWQQTLLPLGKPSTDGLSDLYRTSTMVLRAHEAKNFPGGIIASLSIPWGFNKGDEDLGGYHLVWPRDLVESAGALLASGAGKDVERVLEYLMTTQEADGHWPQNMWLDGTPYWNGIQMDEAALPILLVDLCARELSWSTEQLHRFWQMVRSAARYIVINGPVTQQDRWEEDPGYSPYTLAVQVASLLTAADMADTFGESQVASYLRDTADLWNDSIEAWTYTTDGPLAEDVGVAGYYVRIAPPEVADSSSPLSGFVPIKNRPAGQSTQPAVAIVSPDALALVRFGLRAPDDPRIQNTVKVIDNLLQCLTPRGRGWYRYNNDGYGEHQDGSPFDGSGQGRLWPLLTGERAHLELAAGRIKAAQQLANEFAQFAGVDGMLPEQAWDDENIPERELFRGRPTGSAMPLVWAHAEYVKLLRSLRDGRVFDMPPQPVERYQVQDVRPQHSAWRFNHKPRTLHRGRLLRIELLEPATIRWTADAWKTVHDIATADSRIGNHYADVPTRDLPQGTRIDFTFFWNQEARWEGRDFHVVVRG
ncbi:MAG: glucan 1,4-alpha-glucosidase [Planctomycetaceae bacterium]